MKFKLLLLILFINSINKINGQFIISGQTAVADVMVSVCGNKDTLDFSLFNISGATISNDTVLISLPSGISIEAVLSGSGYSVLTNGFVITSLPTSQGINVKYVIKANCSALNLTSFIPQYISKNPSQTISGLQYFSSIAKPILQIAGNNLDTTNAFQNNQYTRRYTLSNTSTNVKSFIDTIKI